MRIVAARCAVLLLALAPAMLASAPPAGDAVTGKAAYGRCAGCHALAPGQNGVGPSLAGVVGRPVASAPGFAYSAALLSGKGKVWSAASLDAYLASPNAIYPGNRMGIAVPDAKTRADIVAYIAEVKGK